MPIARRDVNLARIASREPNDPMLDLVIRWGEVAGISFGFPLTLLVGDHLIEGHVAPSEEWARLSDEVLDKALADAKQTGAAGWTPDQWDEVIQELKELSFESLIRRRRERNEREMEKWEDVGSPELEDLIKRGGELSRELAEKMAQKRGEHPAFTLKDAVIETTTGQRIQVGTIRVVTAHVAAWWIGRTA
jgi:hypothetical protein